MSRDVYALVLAAGLSRRYGRLKLLEEFSGTPLLRHALTAAQAACRGKVVLVTGLQGLIECRRRFVADKTGGVQPLSLDAFVQVVDGRYHLVQGVDFDLFNQLVKALPLARFGIIKNGE